MASAAGSQQPCALPPPTNTAHFLEEPRGLFKEHRTTSCPALRQNFAALVMLFPQLLAELAPRQGLPRVPLPGAAGASVAPPLPPGFIAFIIWLAIATQRPVPRQFPPPPPSLAAAIGMDCATWNCVYLFMSPTMAMPMRVSSSFCSSSGRDRFSTTNVSSVSPEFCKARRDRSAIFWQTHPGSRPYRGTARCCRRTCRSCARRWCCATGLRSPGTRVGVARAADLRMESLRVLDVIARCRRPHAAPRRIPCPGS